MRVKRFKSDKLVLINTHKYKIDWAKSGASSLETRFRDLIKPFWRNSIVLYQLRIPGCLLRIDFLNVNKKIAVETSGIQHSTFSPFFHRNSRLNYKDGIKRDLDKLKWCEDNNIKLIELYEEDLDKFSLEYIIEKFGIDIT